MPRGMRSLQNKISKSSNSSRYVSIKELADIFGVNISVVNQMHDYYGMPRVSPNKYHLVDSVKWYIDHLNRKLSDSKGSLADEKANLYRMRSKEAKVKVQVMEGKLVYLDQVENEFTVVAEKLKKELMAMSSIFANTFAEISNVSEIYEICDNKIAEIVNLFCDDLEDIVEKRKENLISLEDNNYE